MTKQFLFASSFHSNVITVTRAAYFSGFVCAYLGSNPKHTIYAFMVKFCTIFVIGLKNGQK